MKTAFGDPAYVKRVAQMQIQAMQVNPPAIPFRRDKKRPDEPDDRETKKLRVKTDPEDEDSDEIEVRATVFDEGDAEGWIQWRIQFDDLIRDMNLSTGRQKILLAKALLKGNAREKFLDLLADLEMRDTDGDREYRDDENLEEAIELLGLDYFPSPNSYRRQRNYLRYHLFMMEMPLADFRAELRRQNNFLRYFPIPADRDKCEMIPDDELVDILDRAKRVEWQRDLLTANIDPYTLTLEEYYRYLEKLEIKYHIDQTLRDDKKRKADSTAEETSEKHHKKRSRKDKKVTAKKSVKKREDACVNCGKWHPAPDDKCWSLDKNKKDRPGKRDFADKTVKNERLFSALQMEQIAKVLSAKAKKEPKKKRKISFMNAVDSDDNSSNSTGSDDYFFVVDEKCEHNYAIRDAIRNTRGSDRKSKFRCGNRLTTELIIELISPRKEVKPIRCLLDTGTTSSMILKNFVTLSQLVTKNKRPTTWKTLSGSLVTEKSAKLTFKIPELSTSKVVTWTCHVDETSERDQVPYDMILGLDFLIEMGFSLDFDSKTIKWGESRMEMLPQGTVTNYKKFNWQYQLSQESTVLQRAEERQSRILDANYSKVEMTEYVNSLDHLDPSEKNELLNTLNQYPTLFGGGLGALQIEPIHLELKGDARPYHAKPFAVPHAYLETTKKEIERFVRLGIWERVSDSAWTAPTFIQPKKTGDIRVLTDFRKLNEFIVRRPHPLPKIQDLLQQLEGFKYATAIDLSMGYYHIPLDKHSQGLCGTVMPWGVYKYKVLPMGICNAPDIFQSIMMRLLGDLEFVHVYIDDILITSNGSFTDHMNKLQQVLNRLDKAGFRANVRKCHFASDRVEYLGYDISRNGIHPQPKKVEAILKMQPPTTKKQLRRFLGMINYYRDMWRRRSHILAPLTTLSGKTVKWDWNKECDEAFETIKRSMARETLLNFPDFSKEFHIYTDASDYQLGSVIMQEEKPLAFYSRKLNKHQRRYTTGEQELLSIVETLKEFQNILMGQKIVVHTDHLNILYDKMASPRIIRWRLLLEEYGAKFMHVKGEDNVVADTLSRHPTTDPDDDDDVTTPAGKRLAYAIARVPTMEENDETQYTYADLVTQDDLLDAGECALSPKVISKYQQRDAELLRKAKKNGSNYNTINLEDEEVISHNGRVVVPEGIQDRLIDQYHTLLNHPGMTRMEATIRHVFDFRGLREKVEQCCRTCHICQLTKKQKKKYGHLPPKEAEDAIPWKRVNVDVVGPYTVDTPKGKRTLIAMTMIDPATGWFEIAPLEENDSYSTQKVFDSYWLARYPRPKIVGCDNGSHFKKHFKELVDNYGMVRKTSTEYNPQSNGIIERVHQVLGNALRNFELETRELDEQNPWDEFLSSAAFAIRSTHHMTLGASPAQLVFNRDMFLPIKYVADWNQIRLKRQNEILKSNKRENASRIAHEYQQGDRVLLTTPGILPKLTSPRTGPYRVVRVHSNGTVTLQKGHVQQRVNIRRILPYNRR
jgi:transposase InsO family protein